MHTILNRANALLALAISVSVLVLGITSAVTPIMSIVDPVKLPTPKFNMKSLTVGKENSYYGARQVARFKFDLDAVHQNLVLLDPERERTCQHFKGREPYELAMECLSQRVGYDELDQVRLDVSTRSLTFSPHFRSKAKLSGASVRASSPNSVSQTREPANELTITLNSSVKLDEIPNGAAFPIVRHEVAHGNLMDGLNEETSTEFRRSVHVSSSPESIPPLDLKDAYTERKYANESIHDSLDAILEINRSLRRSFAEARHNAHHPATPTSSKSIRFPTAIHFGKHHDKHPRSTASSSHTDLIAPFLFENTLKLHLFMLMNELNFETALRNNYMQQIRKLRKEKLLNEGNDSTVAAQTAITKHFDAEIKRYTQLVEQQDQEIKSVRERCLKFEQELAIEKITKQSLQEELATLQLKLSEEEKSCEVLKKDMAERDELIAELKLKHDGIMTDFSYLKECELNLNFLTNVLLEREAEKRQLELQAQENENMNSRLKVAHERNYIIQQLESQLRNEIDQQAALLSHANAKLIQHEQLLEVQKRTIQDQATTMENLRLKNIEHISAVKAKYDTIKQINIQLERRIGDLLEKIEGQQSSDSSSNHEFPEDSYSLTPVRIGHYDFI
ncbi:hypothetical protein HK098_003630 [Nowakowskiella sp. JEL0407]|nr:hypothetical protein HK098_003630 [Nowakowskiella sp. JEL0407]